MATDWHFAHYARLAMGGAGLVMVEATSIDLVGRHSYADLGIWSDDHVPGLRRITDFIRHKVPCPRFSCSMPAARPAPGVPGTVARQ
jgi:2,4-dienoyl-CoA reductase-like NADH-dependent reductase (Old Yellow Enzyme family)